MLAFALVVFIVGFITGGITCVAFATYLEEKALVESPAPVSEPILTPTFKADILYYND